MSLNNSTISPVDSIDASTSLTPSPLFNALKSKSNFAKLPVPLCKGSLSVFCTRSGLTPPSNSSNDSVLWACGFS